MSELDTSFYTKYFGGDATPGARIACKKGAEKFLSQVDSRMKNLQEALDNKNTKTITHFAHQLKGSFSTLGGEHLTKIFEKLEDIAPDADEKIKQTLMNEARVRVGTYKEELEEFVHRL